MTTQEFVQSIQDSVEHHCSRWNKYRSKKDLVWLKGKRNLNKRHKKYRQL